MKISTGGRSKVVTVSAKDRSAIMMGGHLADGAYWMEDTLFVTSTYYRQEMPAWVRELNGAGKNGIYFGKKWERRYQPPPTRSSAPTTSRRGRTSRSQTDVPRPSPR